MRVFAVVLFALLAVGCKGKDESSKPKSDNKSGVSSKTKGKIKLGTNSKLSLTMPKRKLSTAKAFKHNFTQTFDKKGPYYVADTADFATKVTGGYYVLTSKNGAPRDFFVPLSLGKNGKNFMVEAKIDQVDFKGAFGMMIGVGKSGNYQFLVNTKTKEIHFYEVTKGGVKYYVKDKGNAAVNPQTNILRFERVDKMHRVFLNGKFLWETKQKPLAGYNYGFSIKGKGTVKVDYHKLAWN